MLNNKIRNILLFSVLLIIFINYFSCKRDPFDSYIISDLGKAVWFRDYNKTKYLIENGADVNKRELNGISPLHVAIYYANQDIDNMKKIILLLIKKGADVNSLDNKGETPLHYSNNYLAMEFLLKAGANVNQQNKEGRTPIFRYINFDNNDNYTHKIELLLKYNANINIKDNEGWTPLSIAKKGKYTKILKLFKKYK